MLPGLDVDDAHAVLLKHPDQRNDYQQIITIQGRNWVIGGAGIFIIEKMR